MGTKDLDMVEESQFDEHPYLYKKKFGAYKPKLVGVVPGFYTNTWLNILVILLMLIPALAMSFAIWYGLIVWALHDTYGYCYACFDIFVAYVIAIIIIVHCGSLKRKK